MHIFAGGHTKAGPREFYDWHVHADLDEFCLVEKGCTTIGHAGRRREAGANQFFLFRHGERHGFWNDTTQSCELTVVHFRAAEERKAHPELIALLDAKPSRRVWCLPPDTARTIGELLSGLLRERISEPPARGLAQIGWMHLILAAALRAGAERGAGIVSAPAVEPDLDRLRRRIETMVESGEPTGSFFRSVPGYDSVRHRFRRRFGISPHTLLQRLRVERAKYLLLNTTQSIKEIADRLGYPRQHEFTRSFHNATGKSPSLWRKVPG